MTRSQKTIIVFLSLIACSLLSAAGFYALRSYQVFASQPLGPALPVAGQVLPPTWTPAATSSLGMVTYAPTFSFATPTPLARVTCGGPNIMNIVAIGADSRTDTYQYGL